MANTKIDSIKLSGSTEIYDLDLPSTATPNIARLTTSGLSVNGNLTVTSSSNLTDVTISKTLKVNMLTTIDENNGSNIVLSSGNTTVNGVYTYVKGTNTRIYGDNFIHLSTTGNSSTVSMNSPNINLSVALSTGSINMTIPCGIDGDNNTITMMNAVIESGKEPAPIISLYNDSVVETGQIGVFSGGLRLRKFYTGSADKHTYLDVCDNNIQMGVQDLDVSNETNFATFGEKFFTITLSQNLLDNGADPFMRINGTLSNFTLEFPTAQTDITIDENNVILNRITPKITTSTGYLIAYPGCGYTSTSSYTIPAVSGIRFTRTNYGESIANTLTGSSLSMHNEFKLTGDDHGAIYQIYGQENRQYGELRVALSTNNSDVYSYAAVTGESAYWGASKLCLTVAIPAGRTAYLWGRNITSLYYSKTSLKVSQNIVTI